MVHSLLLVGLEQGPTALGRELVELAYFGMTAGGASMPDGRTASALDQPVTVSNIGDVLVSAAGINPRTATATYGAEPAARG